LLPESDDRDSSDKFAYSAFFFARQQRIRKQFHFCNHRNQILAWRQPFSQSASEQVQNRVRIQ
jgi:hypothetical protein